MTQYSANKSGGLIVSASVSHAEAVKVLEHRRPQKGNRLPHSPPSRFFVKQSTARIKSAGGTEGKNQKLCSHNLDFASELPRPEMPPARAAHRLLREAPFEDRSQPEVVLGIFQRGSSSFCRFWFFLCNRVPSNLDSVGVKNPVAVELSQLTPL